MEKQVTLNPGQSQRVSFLVSPAAKGIYSVKLDGLPGEFSAITPGILTIDRFFVVGTQTAEDGEFDAHCHVKNTGEAEVSGQIRLIGQIYIAGGQLVREVNEVRNITVQPSEVYDYVYGWYSMRGDNAWVQIIGDWGQQTPRIDFVVGYYHYDPVNLVEVACTAAGSDYAILRYCQRSACTRWDFWCRTPPPPAEEEQYVSYPTLVLPDCWTSIYHAMLGLLPARQYYGKASGHSPGAAHRSASTIFNTL